MRTNDEIISLIQEEAKRKGCLWSELARRVGIAKSTMSRYFNKTREFPLNKADDFARIFNITPEFLLGIQKENKEKPEILTIYNQLEEPRQEKVLDFANAQLDEQESSKVASILRR